MKRIILLIIIINITVAFSIDKDEILNNFRKEVIGDNSEAIKTFKARGTLRGGDEFGTLFNFYVKKPDMMRMDRRVKANLEQKVIRKGESWYMLMSAPHKMEFADSLELVRLASFADPLMLDIFRDSLDAEYVGDGDVNGTPAYIIKATNKLGEENRYFFDKANFRILKREEKTYSMGFPTDSEVYFREYERLDGYLMAKKIEIIVLDKSSFFEFIKLEPNMILQNSVFRMPQ
jgi:outer membrane lipoprotein-sorting protein